jgi:hypothetical protein
MARNPKCSKERTYAELCESRILAWADAFHERTGRWPRIQSGLIPEQLGETWRKVDTALRCGLRGLPGGSSLAQLLGEQRQVRNFGQPPPLSVPQVLGWADSYHRCTGQWPTSKSGPIPEAPGETWRAADQALRLGIRGLPGGSSLARLLAEHRGYRNPQQLARLTLRRVLTWADTYHRRTGSWPTLRSGPIPEAPGETWLGVNSALKVGRRRLRGGSSLAQLLAKHRGVRNPKKLPRLTVRRILGWARAYRRRTGCWPNAASGPIPEAPGETWSNVRAALFTGCRGLPAGLTLADVFGLRRTAASNSERSPLTVSKILAWADAHHKRTGAWPHARSGPVAESPEETWRGIHEALRTNQCGLSRGMTLLQFLVERRGLRTRLYLPRLTKKQIMAWAHKYHRRTGAWPSALSGPIPDAPGETWRTVDEALKLGLRGLRPKSSLARLLARVAYARNRTNLPRLTLEQILAWADDYHRRTGSWPTDKSGPIRGSREETWSGVALALRFGYRGLRAGLSLAQLLARERGARNRASLPPLNSAQVLVWAKEHFQRTGSWPTQHSGLVTGAMGETWAGLDLALRFGYRGLRGGSSLARLRQSRTNTVVESS